MACCLWVAAGAEAGMKIALCSSMVPFVHGGARNIVDWLKDELIERGHSVEVVYLPHVDAPSLLLSQMSAFRWIDLVQAADRVICFRPPSHLIRHPSKVLWFIHHIRLFYDLWDTPYRDFPKNAHHQALRSLLHAADTAAMSEATRIFTNSQIVSQRVRQHNGKESEVLYPPVWRPERFSCDGFNDEIVYVSRVEHHKRQHLLLEALQFTKTRVRVRICGVGTNPDYEAAIWRQVTQLGDRAVFDNRWIDEREKAQIIGGCLAAAYLPLEEDSYGYPTLEAAHSRKPILTASDAGGVLEFVSDGINGRVCEPDPRSLAAAMDSLFLDRNKTVLLGLGAERRIGELEISWSNVVRKLLS